MIDYFNYLPLGGGDDLFWFEIVNWKLDGFIGLMKRNYVKPVLENTAQFQKKKQTAKKKHMKRYSI